MHSGTNDFDLDYLDDLDEIEYGVRIKQRSRPAVPSRPRRKMSHSEMKSAVAQAELDPQLRKQLTFQKREATLAAAGPGANSDNGFTPSIMPIGASKNHMSKHESEWIVNYLGTFYTDELITDVLRRVKGGKEATVYCCRAAPAVGLELVAGKVYHEREFRQLKNDSLYRQGRELLDAEGKVTRGGRVARAMLKRTSFGQQVRHMVWLSGEYETLSLLHKAGADVPKPIAQSDNAILMEYVGDEEGAAPTLNHVTLRPAEARRIFDRLMSNVEMMLAQDRVHADLSAFNVLYWEGEIKIIDFPQAVNPYINQHAYTLLERDVTRLCEYFERYGIASDPVALTRGIWAKAIPS